MRAPEILLYDDEAIADCFAGGGGASEGIEMALGRSPDVAINHNAVALGMHRANHPTTRHLCEDITEVDPKKALQGRKCGFAWFSPDCTYHSKARGGKPFRDRHRARKLRGLAGVVIRWAAKVRPRVLCVENVEEFQEWGPLGADNLPDRSRRGDNFRRWVARLRNLGYAVEWRELVACDYGSPTKRKRLVIVARCDGRPIRWPVMTHGPRRSKPFRTAADHIDFSLPIASIFLTPAEAKEWGRAHGVPAPKRPLSVNTQARIARGIDKFVLQAAEPFIVNVPDRGLLVAPTLIQTSYGEREGQAPRVLDINAPLGTVVAGGIKHSVVAAFLAKHNAGHEATGQGILTPLDTVTTQDSKALVTSNLIKLRGGIADHLDASAISVSQPIPTLSAQGTHFAEVRAFLIKFYGTAAHGQSLRLPLGTVTTKERFGLVTVVIGGEEYVVVDIGMRMLTPPELFGCTGFPDDYEIEWIDGRRLSKKAQTRLVGNAVPPHLARAVTHANMVA